MPLSEKENWRPASVETVEAVLEKYRADDDRETAVSFCRLIRNRAEESWSEKAISRLVHYACNHPDLKIGKLNLHCDKSPDEATVQMLFENTINCVRGMAAGAIGNLLWESKRQLQLVRPAIESLITDPHPAVRMASIEAIDPVLNINRGLAVRWFCEACKGDIRVAASPRALRIFNYVVPSHIDQVGPIIQQMAFSPLADVAHEGARQVTARWIFHGLFEKEFAGCCTGTSAQRKGVASVAAYLFNDAKYTQQCQELLFQLMNDPDREVRNEFRGIFRNKDLLNGDHHREFIRQYIKSKAFADAPNYFISDLKEFSGNLISVAEAIFSVCEELATTLKEKARDIGTRYPHSVSEILSVLLRLYENAQGTHDKQIANRCLDVWDMLFESRVGRAIELTRAIEG